MIPQKTIDKILKGYNSYLCITEIADYADVSVPTVKHYLKEVGLEPHYGRGRPPKMSLEEKILHAHELRLSLRKAELYTGANHKTISDSWKKAGLKPHYNFSHLGLPKETIDKILEAHELEMTHIEAAKYSGVSVPSVSKYWRKAGLSPQSSGVVLPQETIERILKAHEKKMSLRDAAKYSGTNQTTVIKYWRKAGLKSHYSSGNPELPKKTIDKIYEAHKQGMSTYKAANHAGVSRSTIERYWRKVGLKSNSKSSASKVALSVLIDWIFDTKNNPDETLTFEEIKARISAQRNNRNIDDESLEEKLKFVVRVGVYDIVEENGIIKYKAGMPRAMDGCVKD